jgi:D-serine deaminase-like pyridoxal phosphate-dependent protein
MSPGAHISVCVDAVGPLAELGKQAAAAGVMIDVLVEVNAGQDRWAGWVGGWVGGWVEALRRGG